MIVRLTYAEILVAHLITGQRQTMNLKRAVASRYGAPEGEAGRKLDALGVFGEMAVAKGLNLYWSGTVGDYGAIDVGGVVEVRTAHRATDSLIVHPDDKDAVPFVLVLGDQAPAMRLAGWLWGHEAKQERWWKQTERPAFFVPQDDLRSMDELVDLFRKDAA